MQAIQYVIRGADGRAIDGRLGLDVGRMALPIDGATDVSLNLGRDDVVSYKRVGSDLLIELQDGREILLQNIFVGENQQAARLYFSEGGTIQEISFSEAWTRTNYAQFNDAAAANDLVFPETAQLAGAEVGGVSTAGGAGAGTTTAGGTGAAGGATGTSAGAAAGAVAPEVTMAAGPLALAGGAAAGAGSVVATTGMGVIALGTNIDSDDDAGGGSGGSGTGDNGTAGEITINAIDTGADTVLNGDEVATGPTVTGTTSADAEVKVTWGTKTLTTTSDADGNYTVTFDAADITQGEYTATVSATMTDTLGNVLTATTDVDIDTTTTVDINETTVEGDGVIVAAETADGIVVTGTAENAASVDVTLAGVTQSVTAGSDGTWSVTFPGDTADGINGVSTPITAVSTDVAGNVSTITENVMIDTVLDVSFDSLQLTDDVLNVTEAAADFTFTGTTNGSAVTVEFNGVSLAATVPGDGTWSVTFPSSAAPADEGAVSIQAAASDDLGNTASATHTITADYTGEITIDTIDTGSDAILNGDEVAANPTVTGTTSADTEVKVTWGTKTLTTTSNSDGKYTVSFDSADIPQGEYTATVSATMTDTVGNVVTATADVDIDTTTTVDINETTVEGDGVILAAETADGTVVTGTAENAASVDVTLAGVTQSVTAGSDGTWSVTFADGTVDGIDGVSTPITAVSTDVAGNVSTITENVMIDTVLDVSFDSMQLTDDVLNVNEAAADFTFTGTTNGSAVTVEFNGVSLAATVAVDGTWSVTFPSSAAPVSEGIMSIHAYASDDLGNTSSASHAITADYTGEITIDAIDTGSDAILNGDEVAANPTVTGTTSADTEVKVTWGATTLTTTSDADGNYSVSFDGSDITQGEYTATVSATMTDTVGNVLTATTDVDIDTTTTVDINETIVEGDGVILAAETADGTVVTGTAETAASVDVTLAGVTQSVTAGSDGTWSVTFADGTVDGIDGVSTPITAVSTDVAGNVSTITENVMIDTVLDVSFDNKQLTDDVMNSFEAAADFTFTGKTNGSAVTIDFNGVSKVATVAGDGTWSVTFPSSAAPADEGSVTIQAAASDDLGNTASASHTITADYTGEITINTISTGTDTVLNAAELAAGPIVTGTTTPDTEVKVTMGSTTLTTTSGSDGNYIVAFDGADFAQGEYTVTVSATMTDSVGNVQTATIDVDVDTITSVDINESTIEGDGKILAAETADGILVTGTAETAANVNVTLAGVTLAVTVGTDGTWSVTFPDGTASGIDGVSTPITAVSTDLAGNVSTITENVMIDTVLDVSIDSMQLTDNVMNVSEAASDFTFTGTTNGTAVTVKFNDYILNATVAGDGTWSVTFPSSAAPVNEGSLPIYAYASDASGNATSTEHFMSVDYAGIINITDAAIEIDDIVNLTEQADGVVVTGTTTPGADVVVHFHNFTGNALVANDGSWTVTVPADDIDLGQYNVTITAISTTDTGNITTDTKAVRVDTLIDTLTLAGNAVSNDNFVNAAEQATGVTISGTVEPGSTVTVLLGHVTLPAVVDGDGNWSVLFSPRDLPAGDYITTMVATATDVAGNTRTITQSVTVDTVAANLNISSVPIEGDGVVNATEIADGIQLNGVGDPGMTISVTLGNVTHTVQTNSLGVWTVLFAPNEIPTGTHDLDLVIATTDDAGNVSQVTTKVGVDTEVTNVDLPADEVAGDGVINGSEAKTGLVLTGSAEPGSTVVVTVGNNALPATVDSLGNWTVLIPSTLIPAGETSVTLGLTVTDSAGNVAVQSTTIGVDTSVSVLTVTSTSMDGQTELNAFVAQTGINMTGMVEVGSTVMVTFEDTTKEATVSSNGQWTVTFAGDEVRIGEYTSNALIVATDAAGNVAQTTTPFVMDTSVPEAPVITAITLAGNDGVRSIIMPHTGDDYSIYSVNLDDTATELAHIETYNGTRNEVTFDFNSNIPTGTDLIVSLVDDASNESSTLFVLDDTENPSSDGTQIVMNQDAFANFNIEAVDLEFASNVELILTAEQLENLSDLSDNLFVRGGADDKVTITGATNSGNQQTVDGETYNVYNVGDNGGLLIIDEDITVVT